MKSEKVHEQTTNDDELKIPEILKKDQKDQITEIKVEKGEAVNINYKKS